MQRGLWNSNSAAGSLNGSGYGSQGLQIELQAYLVNPSLDGSIEGPPEPLYLFGSKDTATGDPEEPSPVPSR